MAGFDLLEQEADAGLALFLLLGQVADVPSTPGFELTEQHADTAGGSIAGFQLTAQSAVGTAGPGALAAAGIALLSGGSWLPQSIRSSDGSGTWN